MPALWIGSFQETKCTIPSSDQTLFKITYLLVVTLFMTNQSSSIPKWVVFSTAVICFSYLWLTEAGLTAALAPKCCLKSSQEIRFRGASSRRSLYTEPKCFSRGSVSHSAHATSLNTSSYSGFTAQSPHLKRGCGRTAFCTVSSQPKGAAVKGCMWVHMRRHKSAGACFLELGCSVAVGLSLSERRASSLRETDYPAM